MHSRVVPWSGTLSYHYVLHTPGNVHESHVSRADKIFYVLSMCVGARSLVACFHKPIL